MEESRPGDLTAQLRRERLLDMEARLVQVRRRAFAVLALALIASGPWIGFWFLIPLGLALGAFTVADRRMVGSAHPDRWAAGGWAIAPMMIAVSVALTGAAESPATSWFALAAVTVGARFELRGVLVGVAYMVVLLLIVTVGLDPQTVLDRPDSVLFPLAIVVATAILSAAVSQSDREHRHGAVVDPLTGLLNRAALTQRFVELEEQATQSDLPLSVGFIVGDIDHFKTVNDEHGHAAGDDVLKDVAYAMRKCLRAFDLVYRLGGEEFVVLLPGTDEEGAVEIGERLRAAVASASEATGAVPVTMSFGVSIARAPGLDFDALFAFADEALYEAKRAGRDRVVVAGRPAFVSA